MSWNDKIPKKLSSIENRYHLFVGNFNFIVLKSYRSSGPVSFGYTELENNNQQASILSADIAAQTTPGIERAPFSIKNELKVINTDSSLIILIKC